MIKTDKKREKEFLQRSDKIDVFVKVIENVQKMKYKSLKMLNAMPKDKKRDLLIKKKLNERNSV